MLWAEQQVGLVKDQRGMLRSAIDYAVRQKEALLRVLDDGRLRLDNIDCGGDCPSTCADGKDCSGDGDCMSDDCSGGVCVSCMDGVLNGSEADVDCGGSCAAKCANGKMCGSNADCLSGKCSAGACQP